MKTQHHYINRVHSPTSPLVTMALQHAFDYMEGDTSGHDPYHLVRVFNMTCRLAADETGVTSEYAELIAALHDVEDFKITGDDTSGARAAHRWLQKQGAPDVLADIVSSNVAGISFKGAGTPTLPLTIDGKIVQDADRIDAMGAVGIARCFAYGGKQGRPIHDPDVPVAAHDSTEAYLNHVGTSINHFYEKLLLLPDRMNTKAGRRMADQRLAYMKDYLKTFYAEWEGQR